MKRERGLLTELGHSFTSRGCFFHKLADMPHFEGAKFRFDLGKPFDAFGVFAGHAFAIEAKVISRFRSITPKLFRPAQLEGLDGWVNSGGRAFAFIFLWEAEKRAGRRLYVIDWVEFRARGSNWSKAEFVALPHIDRYSTKTDTGNTAYRWNVDLWLIDLIMKS